MAGTSIPKPSERAARRGGQKDTVLYVERVAIPDLPDVPGLEWPERTIEWWNAWQRHPLAEQFLEVDWEYMFSTALVHADMWSGNLDRAPELRIREEKFAATLQARAALRVQLADAESGELKNEKERTRAAGEVTGRRDRSHLRVIPAQGAEKGA